MLRFEEIRAAAERISGEVLRTPCRYSRSLSEQTGAEIFVKYENLQYTASFKERGALNCLLTLSADERKAGVIAMSAGNHAQAVAFHARRLDVPATIVMPAGTPNVKVRQTEDHGARVVLHGETLEETAAFARELCRQEQLTFVHPYDDVAVMAGQGTVALEMLEDVPDLDVLVVPIGGGGLIAGCAVAARAMAEDIRILGVETELYPSTQQALAGLPVDCGGQTIADGIAVKQPGTAPLEIVRLLVEEVLVVPEVAIERAIDLYITAERTVAEGAGAASLAAVLCSPERFSGQRVGLLLSGGNIDTRLLASVLMRSLIRGGRITRLRVEIADRPGMLAEVARLIGEGQGNILEVQHQRMLPEVPARLTELDIVVETRDRQHISGILERLRARGFRVREQMELSGVAG